MKQLPDIEQHSLLDYRGVPFTTVDENVFAYYFLTKKKASHRYAPIAWCRAPGDTCLAAAEDHFQAHGFGEKSATFTRLADETTWRQMEVTYHLRDVGMAGRIREAQGSGDARSK